MKRIELHIHDDRVFSDLQELRAARDCGVITPRQYEDLYRTYLQHLVQNAGKSTTLVVAADRLIRVVDEAYATSPGDRLATIRTMRQEGQNEPLLSKTLRTKRAWPVRLWHWLFKPQHTVSKE